jgi:hypothetical protein
MLRGGTIWESEDAALPEELGRPDCSDAMMPLLSSSRGYARDAGMGGAGNGRSRPIDA